MADENSFCIEIVLWLLRKAGCRHNLFRALSGTVPDGPGKLSRLPGKNWLIR